MTLNEFKEWMETPPNESFKYRDAFVLDRFTKHLNSSGVYPIVMEGEEPLCSWVAAYDEFVDDLLHKP